MYAFETRCPQTPEASCLPEVGITGGCELPALEPGN